MQGVRAMLSRDFSVLAELSVKLNGASRYSIFSYLYMFYSNLRRILYPLRDIAPWIRWNCDFPFHTPPIPGGKWIGCRWSIRMEVVRKLGWWSYRVEKIVIVGLAVKSQSTSVTMCLTKSFRNYKNKKNAGNSRLAKKRRFCKALCNWEVYMLHLVLFVGAFLHRNEWTDRLYPGPAQANKAVAGLRSTAAATH